MPKFKIYVSQMVQMEGHFFIDGESREDARRKAGQLFLWEECEREGSWVEGEYCQRAEIDDVEEISAPAFIEAGDVYENVMAAKFAEMHA